MQDYIYDFGKKLRDECDVNYDICNQNIFFDVNVTDTIEYLNKNFIIKRNEDRIKKIEKQADLFIDEAYESVREGIQNFETYGIEPSILKYKGNNDKEYLEEICKALNERVHNKKFLLNEIGSILSDKKDINLDLIYKDYNIEKFYYETIKKKMKKIEYNKKHAITKIETRLNKYYQRETVLDEIYKILEQRDSKLFILGEILEQQSENESDINCLKKLRNILNEDNDRKSELNKMDLIIEEYIVKKMYDDSINKGQKDEEIYESSYEILKNIESIICDLDSMIIPILAKAIINNNELSNYYDYTINYSLELIKPIMMKLIKDTNINGFITKFLLDEIIHTLYRTKYFLYNYKECNKNLSDYKIEKYMLNEKILIDIKKKINETMEDLCYEEYIKFYSNPISKKIMDIIIKDSKTQYVKSKNTGDKNNVFKITDEHKKIFIYICHLFSQSEHPTISFEYDELINLLLPQKLNEDENVTRNRKSKKVKVREQLEELKNIVINIEEQEYKLFTIKEKEKEFVKIELGNWISNNFQDEYAYIKKSAFQYEDYANGSPVGKSFTLTLKLIELLIDKNKINKLKDIDIFDDILVYGKGSGKHNGPIYIHKIIYERIKCMEDDNWEFKFSDGMDENKNEILGQYMYFNNNDLKSLLVKGKIDKIKV